jgi:hypothetical protein
MYENHPAVGLYTLPLLTWYPMQLVIGSLLAPRLAAYVGREQAKLLLLQEVTDALSIDGDDDNDCDDEHDIMEQGESKVSQNRVVGMNSEPDDSETVQETEIPDSSLEETEMEEFPKA